MENHIQTQPKSENDVANKSAHTFETIFFVGLVLLQVGVVLYVLSANTWDAIFNFISNAALFLSPIPLLIFGYLKRKILIGKLSIIIGSLGLLLAILLLIGVFLLAYAIGSNF